MRAAAGVLRGAAVALLLAVTAPFAMARPAMAQDGAMCRMECGAQFAERAQNPMTVQACLVRCAARAAAMGSGNVTAATVMPNPQTIWTQGPGARRPAPPPDLVQAVDRQARQLRQREAARGRRPGTGPAAPVLAQAQPRPAPPSGASFLGTLMAAAVPAASAASMPAAAAAAALPARAAEPARGTHGAIYLAAAPSRGYGLVVGANDRAAAHRAAAAACAAGTCRPAGEVTDRCAAVAHALRSNNAVVMTSHPSTFTVLAASIGSGPTRADAERQAVASCGQRGRGVVCQVTEARCAE